MENHTEAESPDDILLARRRSALIQELLLTESCYLGYIGDLVEVRRNLVHRDVLSEKVIWDIFSSIDLIYDLHRRFLDALGGLGLDSLSPWEEKLQGLATLLVGYETEFQVYYPYIRSLSHLDWDEWVTGLSDVLDTSCHQLLKGFGLDGALLRPYSRLAKYPLLFKDALRLTPDETERQILVPGIQALERVQNHAWETTEEILLHEARRHLPERVDNWKGYQLETLGSILLHGIFNIQRDSSDVPKQYEIYLFENYLFCFRPQRHPGNPGRPGLNPRYISSTKLSLKGRVFIPDILRVYPTGAGHAPGPIDFVDGRVCIRWSGVNGNETVNISFGSEQTAQKWVSRIEAQRQNLEALVNATPRDMLRKSRHELSPQDKLRIELNVGTWLNPPAEI